MTAKVKIRYVNNKVKKRRLYSFEYVMYRPELKSAHVYCLSHFNNPIKAKTAEI